MSPLLGGEGAAAQDGRQDRALAPGKTKLGSMAPPSPDARLSSMQIEPGEVQDLQEPGI